MAIGGSVKSLCKSKTMLKLVMVAEVRFMCLASSSVWNIFGPWLWIGERRLGKDNAPKKKTSGGSLKISLLLSSLTHWNAFPHRTHQRTGSPVVWCQRRNQVKAQSSSIRSLKGLRIKAGKGKLQGSFKLDWHLLLWHSVTRGMSVEKSLAEVKKEEISSKRERKCPHSENVKCLQDEDLSAPLTNPCPSRWHTAISPNQPITAGFCLRGLIGWLSKLINTTPAATEMHWVTRARLYTHCAND